MRKFDSTGDAILAKMDANFRRQKILTGLLFLAILGNIIKDFLR